MPSRNRTLTAAFENEFASEVLRSDQLRITILMGVIASVAVSGFLVTYYEQFHRSFQEHVHGFLMSFGVVATFALVWLLIERAVIIRMIRKQRRISDAPQYLSALVETSLPTAAMIAGSVFQGPIYTLFTPAVFVYPIVILLSTLRLNLKLCVFTGAVAGLEYSSLALYSITTGSNAAIEPVLSGVPHHLLKGFLLFATGVVAGLVTRQIKTRTLKSFEVIQERNRIRRTFGEYVSPVVMENLMTSRPDFKSERRNVCVMFLDIRNFTGFAEKRSPEDVVAYLESLFEFMIEIVNRHHGVINKFLGDGFMAVFGAPLSNGADCLNAITAAGEILSRVESEVAKGAVLPTRIGIGLHAGEAVTGSIGSSLRREYTVIGDVVNLASRIEQLNKQFGTQLLISEIVRQALGEEFAGATAMGDVQVKGREASIRIYQLA
jgi:adenylate cyclase